MGRSMRFNVTITFSIMCVCVCAHLLGPLISSISHPAHAVLTVHKHLMHIGRLLMYSGGHNILQQFMIWVFAHMNKYIHTCMSEYICVCVFSCKPNCIHGYNTNPNHYLFLSVCFSSILLLWHIWKILYSLYFGASQCPWRAKPLLRSVDCCCCCCCYDNHMWAGASGCHGWFPVQLWRERGCLLQSLDLSRHACLTEPDGSVPLWPLMLHRYCTCWARLRDENK